MKNSVQNAIHPIMNGRCEPRYTGSCYSQPKSSAVAASMEAAFAAASIGSQLMSPSAVQAGAGSTLCRHPSSSHWRSSQLNSDAVGSDAHCRIADDCIGAKNLFSTPPGYIPTSLRMPPHIINIVWTLRALHLRLRDCCASGSPTASSATSGQSLGIAVGSAANKITPAV
jgi:hypothetical protein